MAGVLQKAFDTASRMYRARVGANLAQYGLKIEDIMVENDDVKKALARLTPEEIEARNRRLVRAFDISLKRVPLPADIQAQQKPMELYLADHLKQVEAEREERELLNGP